MEKIIHNTETDEIVIADLTKAELAQMEKDKKTAEEQQANRLSEAAAILEKKQAIYAKLGLTAEEVDSLLA